MQRVYALVYRVEIWSDGSCMRLDVRQQLPIGTVMNPIKKSSGRSSTFCMGIKSELPMIERITNNNKERYETPSFVQKLVPRKKSIFDRSTVLQKRFLWVLEGYLK